MKQGTQSWCYGTTQKDRVRRDMGGVQDGGNTCITMADSCYVWKKPYMNQGKLEVVKQEMARVNTDILGINELNGLEWVNLTQMTIVSTTMGKNPLEEME